MKLDDMPAVSPSIAVQPQSRAARMFLRLLGHLRVGRVDLILPDGSAQAFDSGRAVPHAMLRLSDWRVLDDLLRSGDIGFAEAYIDGRWDTPDLAVLLTVAAANYNELERAIHGRVWGWIAYRVRHLMRANRKAQARRNIQAHYDLGNAFYALWLDPTMTYSSALFGTAPDLGLEAAQAAKYERICARLDIRPGDRVLEVGCGWGGFAEHAIRTRGCRVDGVTLSSEQLVYARERLAGAGLAGQADFQLRDYRDVRGEYDHVVSIEMFEAVGEGYWPAYFDAVRKALRRGGRALVQTITIDDRLFPRYRRGTDFIQQYIFPGGMLPSPRVFAEQAGRRGLRLGDTLAFGADYAETLRRWRQRFNRCVGELNAMGFDNRFIRLWNFYLAYCEAGFRAGNIDVMQLELIRD